MTKTSCGVKNEIAKTVFDAEIHRLIREYGAVRLAKLEPFTNPDRDTLVLFSPVFKVKGDVPIAAATVLDSKLFNIGLEAYGSIKAAAKTWSGEGSLHFEESKQEG